MLKNHTAGPSAVSRGIPKPDRLLRLDGPGSRLAGVLPKHATGMIERAIGLDQINALYDHAVASAADAAGGKGTVGFIRSLLAALKIRVRVSSDDLARVPRKGAFVAVANHPFGALDGLILTSILAEARDDTKVMANYLLGRVPELRDRFLLVDPFHGPDAASRNIGPLRQGLRWLKEGHPLAAFPGGEVAHLRLSNLLGAEGPVADPPWNTSVARMVAAADVPVLPIYFDGHNSAMFQVAGLAHPLLRTALLPRALLGMRDSEVAVRIGSLIPSRRLAQMESCDAVTDYLRRRTYLLRHAPGGPSVRPAAAQSAIVPRAPAAPGPIRRGVAGAVRLLTSSLQAPAQQKSAEETIVSPVEPALMEAEITALPQSARLLDHGEFVVLHARASQIRHVLREIGRLRETTFRQVGEGTGKSLDLDTFDYDYTHLFIWNSAQRQVVGAYRLGHTDRLLPAKGRQGLYTSTLFNYKAVLLQRLNPALEMGRSFVRAEHQRSYLPLLLLWKGIGHFLVQHPHYRYLFGPVSISSSYHTVSRELMVKFLTLHHAMPEGNTLAAPKNPFRPKKPLRLGSGRWDDEGIRRLLQDDEEVSSLVADLEPDQKGLPVLIRQYLKLGAKFLSFNVDRDFGDCLDGLIVVDLLHTEARVLERYMTRPGYASFIAHHRNAGVTSSPEPQLVGA